MPTYEYLCPCCESGVIIRFVPIDERNNQRCGFCKTVLVIIPSAPAVKVVGKAVEGGGPDRFTADALGIPLKELPAGLRTKR